MNSDYDWLWKIFIVGSKGSGKTSIFNFPVGEHRTSSNNEIRLRKLRCKQGKAMFRVEDYDPHKHFIRTSAFQHGPHGLFIIYDVTNRVTFNDLKLWIKEYDERAGKLPKILIGTKIDLIDKREVSFDEAEKFASDNEISYIEVSTKTGHNMENMFKLIHAVIREDSEYVNEIILDSRNDNPDSCCLL